MTYHSCLMASDLVVGVRSICGSSSGWNYRAGESCGAALFDLWCCFVVGTVCMGLFCIGGVSHYGFVRAAWCDFTTMARHDGMSVAWDCVGIVIDQKYHGVFNKIVVMFYMCNFAFQLYDVHQVIGDDV